MDTIQRSSSLQKAWEGEEKILPTDIPHNWTMPVHSLSFLLCAVWVPTSISVRAPYKACISHADKWLLHYKRVWISHCWSQPSQHCAFAGHVHCHPLRWSALELALAQSRILCSYLSITHTYITALLIYTVHCFTPACMHVWWLHSTVQCSSNYKKRELTA